MSKTDEKVAQLEEDVKSLKERVFKPKRAEVRGDPSVRLK